MKNTFEIGEEIITNDEKNNLTQNHKNKLKIVFMGTPDFAVPVLSALDEVFGVAAVVTVPDKPQGRGLKLAPSAVKQEALIRNIPILQPENLKDEDFINELKSINADIFCVVAFRILPEIVFNLPKLGSFNIHGSLLPKFRGAAPINRAIMACETETGLTSFLLNSKVDTGNILLKTKVAITSQLIASELYENLKPIAADLAIKTIELILNNDINPTQQDDSIATKAPKLFPNDSYIDWNLDNKSIRCWVHGLAYHPGARTNFDGKLLKIFRVKEIEKLDYNTDEFQIGEMIVEKSRVLVKCGNGNLELIELQLEGKKITNGRDFALGFQNNKKTKILG